MNYCVNPLIVGVSDEGYLPTDGFDYNWGMFMPRAGCNHLRCEKCGQPLRNLVDADWVGPASRPEVYAMPDLSAHSAVVFHAGWRLYLCRCVECSAAGPEAAANYDYLHLTDRQYWVCGGHPPLELPIVLDGIAIHEGMDLGALVAQAPPDYWPPPLPQMKCDLFGFWMARLYNLLPVPAMREEIARAMEEQLTDPGPIRRAGALAFFRSVSEAVTDQTIKMIRRQFALYAGQPDPTRPDHLLDERVIRLLHELIPAIDHDAPLLPPSPREIVTLDFLRELALTGRYPDILFRIALRDTPWIFSHARELAHANSEWLGDIIYLACDVPEPQASETLAILASDPGLDQDQLRAEARQVIDMKSEMSDSDRAAMLAIFSGR